MQPDLPPGPLAGALAPFAAFGFILKRPGLWWLAVTPFIINLALFALFFWLGYTYFDAWVRALLPGGEGWWWRVLFYVILVLAVILLLGVQVYLFAVVGRIVAAPFLELLTRRVEMYFIPEEKLPDISFMRSMMRVLVQETKRVIIFLVIMLILMIVNLVPGLGSAVYAILGAAVTSFFLASDFLDYSLDRRGLSLSAKFGYLRRLGFTGLLFGGAVMLMGMVPLLNLAFLPLAAVGGTLLYLKKPLGSV